MVPLMTPSSLGARRRVRARRCACAWWPAARPEPPSAIESQALWWWWLVPRYSLCVCVVMLRVSKRGVVESEAQWRVGSCNNLAREGTCISYCLLLTSDYCSKGLEGTNDSRNI
jgi:hypothetical protein